MKIELKLLPEEIVVLSAALNTIYNSNADTRKQKTILSIGYDIADKFDSKAKSLQKKTTLFDAKKKVKMTLKHHEADVLEFILLDQIKYTDIPYIINIIQKTINTLNQKLA